MHKILLIDSLSPIGHINFNNIHISAILKAGYALECAFHEGYSKQLNIPNAVIVHEYPIKKYSNWRLTVLRFLKDVKKNLNLQDYDYIIHSSYDDLTILLANYPKSFLIDHNNLSRLGSIIRRVVFNLISLRHIHISLSTEIQGFLNANGISNILIPHGLVSPFPYKTDQQNAEDDSYKIFIPSAGSSDIEVIRLYFSNDEFIQFLKKHNIEISIRSSTLTSDCKNIKIFQNRLDESEYEKLFKKANLIWLPYPKSFENRVSGVLMEAIANQKDVLLPNIKAFEQYKDFIDSYSFYENLNEVMTSITNKKVNPKPILLTPGIKKTLSPDYSVLKQFNT